jgi:hypothetical protein
MEPNFLQTFLQDLDQQKPLGERLKQLNKEQLQRLQTQVDAELKQAHGQTGPERQQTLLRLRELIRDTVTDQLRGFMGEMIKEKLFESIGFTPTAETLEKIEVETPEKQQGETLEKKQVVEQKRQLAAAPKSPEHLSVFEKRTDVAAPAPIAPQPKSMMQKIREFFSSKKEGQAADTPMYKKPLSWIGSGMNWIKEAWANLRTPDWVTSSIDWIKEKWSNWFNPKSAPAPASTQATQIPTPVIQPPSQPQVTPAVAPSLPSAPAVGPSTKPSTPTPSPSNPAVPSKPKEEKEANQKADLLDGKEHMIDGHRVMFSTDEKSLLSIDGKRYAAQWNLIDINGVRAKGTLRAIEWDNGTAILHWNKGNHWKISSREFSALVQRIMNGRPDNGYFVPANSFLAKLSYTDIAADGKTTNDTMELRIIRL